MPSFASRVALATVEADLSAVRWFSAVRRAVVVIGVLVAGTWLVGIEAAVNAATAAFLIGLLDKGRSPRSTWRTMALGTAMMCVVTVIAGLLAPYSAAMLLVMVLLAFCSGVSMAVDPRAPQLFLFGALLIASHLVNPLTSDQTLSATLMVAAAGGLQTLIAWLAAPVIGDLPERRQLSDGLRSVAAHCQQIGNRLPDLQAGARSSSRVMGQAESMIRKGDLAADHRSRYIVLLADADAIRIEARAFYARSSLGVPVPADPATIDVFAKAADVLELAARITDRRHPKADLARLDEMIEAIRLEYEDKPVSKTAASVLSVLYSLPSHLHDVVDDHQVRRRQVSGGTSLAARARAAVGWGTTSLKYGLRMSAAALVGEVAALALHLTHGSWVAVTAMMLLRPDGGPTAPRILMRALGTTAAVGAVLVVLWLTDGSTDARVVFIAVFVSLAYTVVAVNYSATTAMTATAIVLLLSLTYPDPKALVFARWVDVLIGCVVGTAFAFAIPLWKRTSLGSDAAKYADAVADWISSIGNAAALDPADRGAALTEVRTVGSGARDARQVAMATFNTTLLEPPSRSQDAGSVGVVISWIRRCSDAGIAAEAVLRHASPETDAGRRLALATAADLHATADRLRSSDPDSDMPAELAVNYRAARSAIDSPGADRVTGLMARAELSASAALRASYRIGSAS